MDENKTPAVLLSEELAELITMAESLDSNQRLPTKLIVDHELTSKVALLSTLRYLKFNVDGLDTLINDIKTTLTKENTNV